MPARVSFLLKVGIQNWPIMVLNPAGVFFSRGVFFVCVTLGSGGNILFGACHVQSIRSSGCFLVHGRVAHELLRYVDFFGCFSCDTERGRTVLSLCWLLVLFVYLADMIPLDSKKSTSALVVGLSLYPCSSAVLRLM